jgi:hypothetical protein
MATADTTTTDTTTDDNAAIIRDAHDRILQAIADLKTIGVAVPIALHLARTRSHDIPSMIGANHDDQGTAQEACSFVESDAMARQGTSARNQDRGRRRRKPAGRSITV